MQNSDFTTNSIPKFKVSYLENARDRIDEITLFLDDWHSEAPTLRIQTSGSTGVPKDFLVEKRFLRASAEMTISYFNLKRGNTALLCLNTSSIAGKMMIIRAILADMELIVAPVSSHPLQFLQKRVDFAAMVPLQVQQILKDEPEQLKMITHLLVGGAAINEALWNQLASIGTSCYQSFGMTETYSHIALRGITTPVLPFEVLNGVTIKANPTLNISAPKLGIEHLITNDVVDLVDSNHFYWLGRVDFVINSGGIKLHPEQIEQQLDSLIDLPFFVTGVEDERLGQKLVLCVEGDIYIDRDSFSGVENPYEIPKEIYFFQKFHYTHSGKIDRNRTLLKLKDARRQVL